MATTATMQKIGGRYSGRYMAAMATTDSFSSREDKYVYTLHNKHLLDFVFNFFLTLRTGNSEKECFRLRAKALGTRDQFNNYVKKWQVIQAVLVSAKTRDA